MSSICSSSSTSCQSSPPSTPLLPPCEVLLPPLEQSQCVSFNETFAQANDATATAEGCNNQVPSRDNDWTASNFAHVSHTSDTTSALHSPSSPSFTASYPLNGASVMHDDRTLCTGEFPHRPCTPEPSLCLQIAYEQRLVKVGSRAPPCDVEETPARLLPQSKYRRRWDSTTPDSSPSEQYGADPPFVHVSSRIAPKRLGSPSLQPSAPVSKRTRRSGEY